MSMPSDVPIIDLMLSLPILDTEATYGNLRRAARDKESREGFAFPAQYMFRGVPHDWGKGRDPVEATLEEMDRWGIERAMLGAAGEDHLRALSDHPDRFFASAQVDPNRGMDAVYDLVAAYEKYGVKAASCFPAAASRQLPPDSSLPTLPPDSSLRQLPPPSAPTSGIRGGRGKNYRTTRIARAIEPRG